MRQRLNNRISRSANQPDGSVLIVTIWIVLVLASLILVLARRIRVDALSSANAIAAMQAESVVNGAIEYILSELSEQFNLETEDAAPDIAFNQVIWKTVKGIDSKMPPPRRGAFIRVIENKVD